MLPSQELYQALLNTCAISKNSQHNLENIINSASTNNITFSDLTQTNQELYKALLNTCNISDEAKQILCNILNNNTNNDNAFLEFIDSEHPDHRILFMLNNSLTLNFTPRQLENIIDDYTYIIILDTVTTTDAFYNKRTALIVDSLTSGADLNNTLLSNDCYVLFDGPAYSSGIIAFIAPTYDDVFTRTYIPLGWFDSNGNIIYNATYFNLEIPWDTLQKVYTMSNLTSVLPPLTIYNSIQQATGIITNVYYNPIKNRYQVDIEDNSTHKQSTFLCDSPFDLPYGVFPSDIEK